ncbi:uncharacterized protein Bfra_005607 [Botrytis fragariae]|uniref:Uncharacterized protein n=1 Tax=Botrytis fragariae TaxID=1964551 RepID=A0A8H6EHC8_9HELO|nr:uncharacterized protein Bfra_005607 [Botrytis fragariae]KAF5872253.1 hypothetical protein Bfra_005607 [Botrytis fragariae]
MPFTEFIKPSIVQSDGSRDDFANTIVPAIRSFIKSAPGFKLGTTGHSLFENNVAVPESSFIPIVGIEWENPDSFHSIVQSERFPVFVEKIKPYLTAPASPELYETDISPKDIFASPVIEIFRINVHEDSEKETAARTAWEALAKALKGTNILSGVSVNLPEKLFLGLIGWSGIEQRNMALDKVEHLKQAVDSLGDSQSFVAELNTVV